ncbi:MAG: hypothetical protein Q7R40_13800 [Phaeospirillum sp.]|nr:hypothetical protein [Phaeospirillum sp.]
MRIIIIAILTLLALGRAARADDLHDFDRQVVAQYLSGNPPIIKRAQNPADVVRVWQDMVMVKKMIYLEIDNALHIQTRPQLVRRIDAAMTVLKGQEDSQVVLLADIVEMFAYSASAFRAGQAPHSSFARAGTLLTGSGTTALARDLDRKYSKPGTIIPPEPALTKW